MLRTATLRRVAAETERVDRPPPLVPLHQHPGSKPLDGTKTPTLVERISDACGVILGEEYRELVYAVLEGIKRRQIAPGVGRKILERSLPATRPIPVLLPLINTAADCVEADRRLMAAANSGRISHTEWGTAQENILRSWQIRREARLDEP